MKLVIILEMILSKIEEGGRGDEETGGCWLERRKLKVYKGGKEIL